MVLVGKLVGSIVERMVLGSILVVDNKLVLEGSILFCMEEDMVLDSMGLYRSIRSL